MLTVTFASNLGLYRTFIDAGLEEVYIKQGYDPFIDMLLANGKIKISLFIEGVTSRFIADKYPELADKIRAGVASEQFEIGTYTYNHPVLSTIPYRDTYKQIEEGLKIDQEVWGVEPKGTMLPEAGWDPSLPKILTDLGISYMIMGKADILRDFPETPADFLHRPFTVNGVFGSAITAVTQDAADWERGEDSFFIEGGIVQGPEVNVDDFDKRVEQLVGDGDGEGMIMLSKNDGEFVYECTLKKKYGIDGSRGGYFKYSGESLGDEPRRLAQEMKKGWDKITSRSDVCFKTVSEFLAENKPDATIDLRPSYKAHREWLEGSEKVAAILEESRNEIRRAEYALKLAGKIGMDTNKAKGTVRGAWLLLLEAEISTGRRACAHDGGKASRICKSMELAIKAAELAESAVDDLG